MAKATTHKHCPVLTQTLYPLTSVSIVAPEWMKYILEKQKALAALVPRRLGSGVELLGFVRKGAAFECREGIVVEKGLRDLFSAAFGNGVIGFA